jgi:hypothetical protein
MHTKFLTGRPEGKRPLVRPRCRYEDSVDMVRFQVSTSASMNMTEFWGTAPCSPTDVSEVCTISIIKAMTLMIYFLSEWNI